MTRPPLDSDIHYYVTTPEQLRHEASAQPYTLEVWNEDDLVWETSGMLPRDVDTDKRARFVLDELTYRAVGYELLTSVEALQSALQLSPESVEAQQSSGAWLPTILHKMYDVDATDSETLKKLSMQFNKRKYRVRFSNTPTPDKPPTLSPEYRYITTPDELRAAFNQHRAVLETNYRGAGWGKSELAEEPNEGHCRALLQSRAYRIPASCVLRPQLDTNSPTFQTLPERESS